MIFSKTVETEKHEIDCNGRITANTDTRSSLILKILLPPPPPVQGWMWVKVSICGEYNWI